MLESSNLALKYAAEACCNTQAEVYLCTVKLSLHTLKIYSLTRVWVQVPGVLPKLKTEKYVANKACNILPHPRHFTCVIISEDGHTEGQYLYEYPHFSDSNNMQFPLPTPSHDHRPDVVHVLLPHRHFPLPTLRNYHIARGHPIHPAGASPIRTWALRLVPDETISQRCRRQTAVLYQRPQCPAIYVHVVQEAGALQWPSTVPRSHACVLQTVTLATANVAKENNRKMLVTLTAA